MKNAALLARLRRIADGLLPTDPDANLVFIRVLRSDRSEDGRYLDDGQEVKRAHASLQMQGLGDRSLGTWMRDVDESERAFLSRVRAEVRPHAARQRINVVAYADY